ncbi:MAG: DotU family type IV/VI secretion system protein [Bilophila sp.]
MEILDRFAPLMAQALHFSSTPAGLAVPLNEVQTTLRTLVDAEQASRLEIAPEDRSVWQEKLRLCRFAVYAWVDEILLNASRADAGTWLPLSLQALYFDTSSAGTRFFVDLEACLQQALASDTDTTLPMPATNNPDLEPAFVAQFSRAATVALPEVARQPLRVYATCLLYGFCGRYFDRPDTLHALRKAARDLLATTAPAVTLQASPRNLRLGQFFFTFEPVLYVLLPLLVCVAFGLYCADIVANLPVSAL